jgi:hypothetical protein
LEFDQKFCQTFAQFHVIWGFGNNKLPNFSKTTKEGEKICSSKYVCKYFGPSNMVVPWVSFAK